jgi:hypothetical protein
MAYEEIVQSRASMQADIQEDSGKTLRLFTIHALFPLSIFTEPLQSGVFLAYETQSPGSFDHPFQSPYDFVYLSHH